MDEAEELLKYHLEDFDPHEYYGLVFDGPLEDIPVMLAKEIARVERMELWAYQHFANHQDECFEPEDCILFEPLLVKGMADILSERFPKYRFVIVVRPTQILTWYQATKTALTEDEEEWTDFSAFGSQEVRDKALELKGNWPESKTRLQSGWAREGGFGLCERCGSGIEGCEPLLAESHRGIRLIDCPSCDASLIHSTRTIRYRVGF